MSLTLSAFSMSFAPEAPDSNGLKHVATVVSGLVVAFLTTAILIPMVQPRLPVRPAGVIAKAMAVTLVVAAVTVSTVWLASFLAGIRSDQRVRAAAAFTSVWFIPLIVFGDQRSSQVVEAWIGISIQFACLGVLLSNTIPSLPTGGGHQPSPIPSFEALRGQAISRDALIASFCALGGLCAVFTWRVPLAQGIVPDCCHCIAATKLAHASRFASSAKISGQPADIPRAGGNSNPAGDPCLVAAPNGAWHWKCQASGGFG